jgi:hypothetical protein
MFDAFAACARIVRAQGGKVAIEWPEGCSYWKLPKVIALCEELGLEKAKLHGCAFGLKNSKGEYMKKPWIVATNDEILFEELNRRRCTGTHKHVWVRGKEGSETEGYTDSMARCIHQAWARSKCYEAMPAPMRGVNPALGTQEPWKEYFPYLPPPTQTATTSTAIWRLAII